MSISHNDFKNLVHEVLDERDSIDKQTHHDHHRYVAHLIERKEQMKRRQEKVKTHVFGWLTVTAITGLVYSIGLAIKKFFS